MDRASVYDAHNRVFYLFYLGRFQNRPMYHYGETTDIDATEFYIQSQLPFYQRIMYIPIDTKLNAFYEFDEYIQIDHAKLPVQSLQHLAVFSPSSLEFEMIIQKIDELYHTHVDKEM
jgi:hypothetical protein